MAGGVANHVLNLARALSERGHKVTVVTSRTRGSLITAELNGPIRIIRIRTAYRGARFVFPILATLANRKMDIVHWHIAARYLDTKASRWIRAKGKVFTNHTSVFVASARDRSGLLESYLIAMALADRVIVPSRELGDLSAGCGIPLSKIRYIPNGVDLSKFDVPADPVLAGNGQSVVTVRRLVAKNGVDVLIRAWPLVLQEHPSARLTIAGDGPERPAIVSLARDLGVSDSIDLLGNVPPDEIPGILSAADVFAIPSRIEATSIACLEAMAAGLPVVGTSVGGIPELVSEGTTGLLVPPDEPKLLARALNRLLSDPGLRTRLGRNARKRAEANFSWDDVAMKTEAVYREALAEASSGQPDPSNQTARQ